MDYAKIGQVVSKAIVDSADYILARGKFDKTFRAMVIEKTGNTAFKIRYNGREYSVSGPSSVNVNDYVWVCAPQNDWSSLFISSLSL